MGEKRLDLRRAHLSRMAHAMESDVAAHPMDVLVLGAYAVVAGADDAPHLIQQAGRLLRHVDRVAHVIPRLEPV
jgi:hypothetical protein